MSQKTARILFISHGPLLYGAQRSLLAFLTGVNREIIEPFLLIPREGPLADEARKLDIPVIILPVNHWVAFGDTAKMNYFRRVTKVLYGLKKRVADIASVITQHDIDLVYTNTVTLIEGALAARATKRPHLWHLREHVSGNKDLKAALSATLISKTIAALSDKIIMNSQSLGEGYKISLKNNKVAVVYNGVDLNSFPLSNDNQHIFRQELGLGQSTKVISLIGSITPRKGLNTFIEMSSKLTSNFDDIAFIVAGDGEARLTSELKAKVNQLGLSDRFHFVGWRTDVDSILRDTDLLVVSAEQEPFGRTVVEAMAAGVPVVSTRCGGPEEIIIDGETGFLVPANGADELASAAAKVLSDPALASAFSTKGRLRVEKMFSEEAYVRNIETILIKLTNPSIPAKESQHANKP